MQIKLLFRLVLAVIPLTAIGQSSYVRTGSTEYHWLDRMEIKTRHHLLNQSFAKPVDRRTTFEAVDSLVQTSTTYNFTNLDRYYAQRFLNDSEWRLDSGRSFNKWGVEGFRSRGNDGYLVFNPIIRSELSKETNTNSDPFITSSGFDLRGAYKKIGFNLYATANTERLPGYMASWVSRYNTVPGGGNFKSHSNKRVSYLDIRGSVQTSVTKYIDLQVGYDRHFLGNGHRSLFLSDFSNSTAFVKTNIRVWRLNFQSLYMQLTPQDGIVNAKGTKKFLRVNTLSIDAAKWLNISFFDAVVLGRKNGFDLNYVLPITFLRAMEQQSGSPDNALFGMNAKANLAGKIQLYGQIVLDEFKLSEIKARSGWWANKFGYQLGAKYIDALGIENLDLQVETNRVRPFTYTHFDSISNYTHYNQPLAHPLGASFHEYIGILRYQATKRLHLNAKAVYYKQGLDSLGFRTGNNVLINYLSKPRDYGWEVGSGDKATCLFLSAVVSYELLNNWFIDVSIIKRNFKTELTGQRNTTMVSAGIRWNITRREFDF